MSEMKDRLHTGELYLPGDEEIIADQTKRLDRLYDFNMTRPTEYEKRYAMLKEMFAEIDDGCYIEPPLRANFGGAHVHFGKGVYANFNLTMVDDTHIYVGDYTMLGPNVTLMLFFFSEDNTNQLTIHPIYATIISAASSEIRCRE